jgi:copper resistance protein B
MCRNRMTERAGMRIKFVNVIALVVLVLNLSPVWAMESMPGMDHRSMQGGSAPPDARDPNAYADGYDSGPHALHLSGHHKFGAVLVDSLELVDTSDNSSAAYDLQAWYGKDYDRLVFKAEGTADNGTLQDASTELLWGHAVAAYWDAQLGVRYDSGVDPSRGWLALGLQGLAPYWFELDTTAYFGDAGRSALRLKAEYELLFTQKLILQPRLEANFYGQSDPARGLGAGLSDLEVGLRLRYEIRREFAPYLGIVWTGKYGGTADDAQAAGENTKETQLVAGLRLWF